MVPVLQSGNKVTSNTKKHHFPTNNSSGTALLAGKNTSSGLTTEHHKEFTSQNSGENGNQFPGIDLRNNIKRAIPPSELLKKEYQ